jgi:hypothetical protein
MYICFGFNVEVTFSCACYEHIVELNIHTFSSINFLKLMNSTHILLLVHNLECAPIFALIMMLLGFLDVHVLSNMWENSTLYFLSINLLKVMNSTQMLLFKHKNWRSQCTFVSILMLLIFWLCIVLISDKNYPSHIFQ